MHGRVTCIERDIAKLEAKEELAQQDQRKAERLIEQIKDNDKRKRSRYCRSRRSCIRWVSQQNTIKIPSTLSTAPNSSRKLAKRLRYIDQQKEATATSMHSPPVGTEAPPKLWLQKCQKDLNALSAQLTGIIGDILALAEENTALFTNVTTIQGASSELHF